jgi:hypothetical protein
MSERPNYRRMTPTQLLAAVEACGVRISYVEACTCGWGQSERRKRCTCGSWANFPYLRTPGWKERLPLDLRAAWVAYEYPLLLNAFVERANARAALLAQANAIVEDLLEEA